MVSTISIQLVRDRALDRGEVSRLRQHARSSGLARQGDGFAVAPPGTSGVIVAAVAATPGGAAYEGR
jgi:hypothetical protein